MSADLSVKPPLRISHTMHAQRCCYSGVVATCTKLNIFHKSSIVSCVPCSPKHQFWYLHLSSLRLHLFYNYFRGLTSDFLRLANAPHWRPRSNHGHTLLIGQQILRCMLRTQPVQSTHSNYVHLSCSTKTYDINCSSKSVKGKCSMA